MVFPGDLNPCGPSWRAAQQGTAILEASETLWKQFPSTVVKQTKRESAPIDLISKNLEELVRGVKDEGQPWLERPRQGGVESPERREQSKKQDHKPGLSRAVFTFLRDLLGRVPQDAALERKGVQET